MAQAKPRHLVDQTIELEDDLWTVVNVGAVQDGEVYCHLSSTSRGWHTRTGWRPVQSARWIPLSTFQEAA